MDDARKELDAFINVVIKYAKKHGLSYVIAAAKRLDNQYAVMDSWRGEEPGALEAMTQALVKPGDIANCIGLGIVNEAMEAAKKHTH